MSQTLVSSGGDSSFPELPVDLNSDTETTWTWNTSKRPGRTQYPAVSVQPAASEVCLQISAQKSSLTRPSVSSYTLLFVSVTSWRLKTVAVHDAGCAASLRDHKTKPRRCQWWFWRLGPGVGGPKLCLLNHNGFFAILFVTDPSVLY